MTADFRQAALEKAAALFRTAKYAVAFTGAGVSTPSGIPDFRSEHTGLWTQTDPMEVASLTAFRRRPEQVYNWLRPLAAQMRKAQPNPAHAGLAQLENRGILKAVITQNIDGLHQQAGSRNVVEVHGSMTQLECLHCHRTYPAEVFFEVFLVDGELPRCETCRSILKPSITLFEEMLPDKAWNQAERACRRADLMLVAGSSLEVTPAAYLPMTALDNNAVLIINNLSRTPLDSRAAVLLPWDSAEILPVLAALLQE